MMAGYWVAPNAAVINQMNKLRPLIDVPETPLVTGEDYWIRSLSHYVNRSKKISEDLLVKFYRSAKERPQGVCKLETIEKVLMGFSINLDDTNIPCLPGNYSQADDLVTIRAEMEGIQLDKKEAREIGKTAIKLSQLIALDYNNMSYYQDQAPFDCLRPPKISAIV